MNAPTRIQRRRTKGWRKPAGAVYVGRGTRYGNPWVVVQTRTGWAVNWIPGSFGPLPPADKQWTDRPTRYAAHETAMHLYVDAFAEQSELLAKARAELRGRDLMCWCPPDLPCHVDVLLALANEEAVR